MCKKEFIRPLAKLHMIAKIGLFGVFIDKFFCHIFNMLLKFVDKSAQKSSIFSTKASFARGLS
jgi:hypothetical protein